MTLADGTVLTPPPEVVAGETPGGYGPCWALPWWVTADDLDQTSGTQQPVVDD